MVIDLLFIEFFAYTDDIDSTNDPTTAIHDEIEAIIPIKKTVV